MEAFVEALIRDPVRAASILHISFIPDARATRLAYCRPPPPFSIFPEQPTEQFWTLLEQALRLVTRIKSIGLLLGGVYSYDLSFPDRFIGIIHNVFKASRIATLEAYLRAHRLFQLCQAWPSLTTLRAKTWDADLVNLPSDALPLLRHLESDIPLMCHITPGRPIETWYNVGNECYCCSEDLDDLKQLTATIRSCETLRTVRVDCVVPDEDNVAALLPAFSHDTLRSFYISIIIERLGVGDDPESHEFRLTPSLVVHLPLRTLGHFPKLEILQITLEHDNFRFIADDPDNKDTHAVAKALAAFLTSEGNATLCQVEVVCYFRGFGSGAVRFLATRCVNHWDVKVTLTKGSSVTITPQFDNLATVCNHPGCAQTAE